ncbi:Ger(x)C family spore germination protein [Clostridium folliculivorans]|uniref:Germination protein n=1 Tax=Clostridium folliculivorans TaxID=2886038 RepID=A0A9W5XYG5_9CLOT|nr:Ger(x)C family spore germination protein [Clostridium folliculivorans]GKU23255.1 germination protein [Clostridium folliculivorans]GKU29372.1 germination protein [Clostridium folliculivorans]
MKNMKSIIMLLICIILSLSLTSCWSAVELNKLGIVTGVALDKSSKEEDLNITAQVGVPKLEKSNSGVGGKEQFVNIKEKGKNVSDALKNISREYNRVLFFAHNQVVIFNKDLAQQGLSEQLDFFLRQREMRPLTWMLVSDGEAASILETHTNTQDDPGINIGKLIKNEKNVSQLPLINFKEFTARLMSKTTSPVIPIIQMKTVDEKTKVPYIASTAVFKKDKMIGELNESESMGLLWGINKVKYGTITVNSPNGNDKVAVRIIRSKTHVKPKIEGEHIYMNIYIDAEGDILEQTSSEDLSIPKIIKVIEENENLYIGNQVLSTWSKAKEMNADVFGFGDLIYKYKPKKWKSIENKWDNEFQKITVNVEVNAKIRRMGKITKPPTYQGK